MPLLLGFRDVTLETILLKHLVGDPLLLVIKRVSAYDTKGAELEGGC